ncbi:mucin glycoprotein [Thermococcus guaymasensis DSM 11113]|uniref:Mucin glycoprotein n=1 Tax=Thermococcus guaymasensis DSM 11113 TaxID=1432656 RepID=A0A0X1KL52_9EURY|nr:winged helix-turn-helix transcriptional regulator [Thermococcus guaymasensis]AJC72001.1 mucin glycoprotein [Thermococcus guaymasensis DSM 11113]
MKGRMVSLVLMFILTLSLVVPAGAQSVVSLSLRVYEDGYVLVNETISTANYTVALEIPLLGEYVEGLIAVDENGNVLPVEINGGNVTVYFENASLITISYYTPDLTSKDGPVWTVSLESPVPVEIALPENSIIVDLSDIPLQIRDNVVVMPAGNISVSYVIPIQTTQTTTTTTTSSGGTGGGQSTTVTTTTPSPTSSTTTTSSQPTGGPSEGSSGGGAWWVILVIILVGAGMGYAYFRRGERTRSRDTSNPEALERFREKIESMEDLNDDEKGALIFLIENGGKAPQSRVRKALGLPKTTAWRMFKRLEERGLVRIYKLGRENWVELVLE